MHNRGKHNANFSFIQLFLDALINTSYSNMNIQTRPIIDFFISSATG